MSITNFTTKYQIIQMGDERGVGSIVKKTGFFGRVTTWTIKPDRDVRDKEKEDWFMDEWVCRESGEKILREFTPIDAFYTANYLTMKNKAEGAAK